YGTVPAVGRNEAQDALRELIAALGVPVVVHCCADRPPVRLLAGAGVAGVGIDATQPVLHADTAVPAALDALGEVWDAGTPLLLGVVPARDPDSPPALRDLARVV